jgi:hypothetical protein
LGIRDRKLPLQISISKQQKYRREQIFHVEQLHSQITTEIPIYSPFFPRYRLSHTFFSLTTMSAPLKVGDNLPSGVTFSYIPYTPEKGDITSCGIPINYDASKGNS